MINSKTLDKMWRLAKDQHQFAHSPYSKFCVGAAVLTKDSKIFTGCNVENASYGATVCAERIAVFKAVSEGAKMPLQAVYVVSEGKDPWPPCGMCRQVIAEFCSSETLIIVASTRKNAKVFRFSEIFPHSFSGDFL